MFSLNNKSAVITGAGSGIGKSVALLFARQGAKVHIIDFNLDAAQKPFPKSVPLVVRPLPTKPTLVTRQRCYRF